MPVENLSDRIKQQAAALGFSACRITSADPPPHHKAYQQWLHDGCNGEMQYLERQEEKRSQPSLVLEDARSIVLVALNYSVESGRPQPSHDPNSGVIARYARYDDYHDLFWDRLAQLLKSIQEIRPEAKGRVYCDTGPVTERDLAMRAGLGWIGKHTNLISRTLGNWFLIGSVFLDIDLDIDPPESQHCGTCTRCIPACPTGAITEPYHLDARRCIAYLTIELKGSIPVELRPLIGNRIFGCDDCLAVCPWNKFAVEASGNGLHLRNDLTNLDLIELLTIDNTEFKRRFAGSPILRAKRRGFLRNVCVALGNIGNLEAVEPLKALIATETEPLILEHAIWALERLNSM